MQTESRFSEHWVILNPPLCILTCSEKELHGGSEFRKRTPHPSILQLHHADQTQSEPIHHTKFFTLFRYRFNLSLTGAAQFPWKQFIRIDCPFYVREIAVHWVVGNGSGFQVPSIIHDRSFHKLPTIQKCQFCQLHLSCTIKHELLTNEVCYIEMQYFHTHLYLILHDMVHIIKGKSK